MQNAIPQASTLSEDPLESGPVCVGPVCIGFYDWSWCAVIIAIGAWTCDLWPQSPAAISGIVAIIVLLACAEPRLPRVCEAHPDGLFVRSPALSIRFAIMRIPWGQLARYYWRQDASGWRLVLKVCRHRPGIVDNTFTWQFPRMTADEQHCLDAVLRLHCNLEQVS